VYCSYSELFVNILLKAILTFSNKLATQMYNYSPNNNLMRPLTKHYKYAI